MKNKLVKTILTIATVAYLSITAFQVTEKDKVQSAKKQKQKQTLYMVDPGPGGG
ncbi:hypothetical protein [Bacillus cereus]|uniref:Complement C1q protein n=1 Tax=Bacillus cereus TIAC219 TaxID=718222 RepID=A0ABC9STK8_BACCE|nr:hypothetical protein [Bacillus cereus]EJP84680.1 hypothetical protein IC1_05208 [Bacillus cereus VD022]EOQ59363.1 hypothetical protein IAY_05083 [Bacillus cereus TIAC219]